MIDHPGELALSLFGKELISHMTYQEVMNTRTDYSTKNYYLMKGIRDSIGHCSSNFLKIIDVLEENSVLASLAGEMRTNYSK